MEYPLFPGSCSPVGPEGLSWKRSVKGTSPHQMQALPDTQDPLFVRSILWSELRARKQMLQCWGNKWMKKQNTAHFTPIPGIGFLLFHINPNNSRGQWAPHLNCFSRCNPRTHCYPGPPGRKLPLDLQLVASLFLEQNNSQIFRPEGIITMVLCVMYCIQPR